MLPYSLAVLSVHQMGRTSVKISEGFNDFLIGRSGSGAKVPMLRLNITRQLGTFFTWPPTPTLEIGRVGIGT
jgi:hypothetical protein